MRPLGVASRPAGCLAGAPTPGPPTGPQRPHPAACARPPGARAGEGQPDALLPCRSRPDALCPPFDPR